MAAQRGVQMRRQHKLALVEAIAGNEELEEKAAVTSASTRFQLEDACMLSGQAARKLEEAEQAEKEACAARQLGHHEAARHLHILSQTLLKEYFVVMADVKAQDERIIADLDATTKAMVAQYHGSQRVCGQRPTPFTKAETPEASVATSDEDEEESSEDGKERQDGEERVQEAPGLRSTMRRNLLAAGRGEAQPDIGRASSSEEEAPPPPVSIFYRLNRLLGAAEQAVRREDFQVFRSTMEALDRLHLENIRTERALRVLSPEDLESRVHRWAHDMAPHHPTMLDFAAQLSAELNQD